MIVLTSVETKSVAPQFRASDLIYLN